MCRNGVARQVVGRLLLVTCFLGNLSRNFFRPTLSAQSRDWLHFLHRLLHFFYIGVRYSFLLKLNKKVTVPIPSKRALKYNYDTENVNVNLLIRTNLSLKKNSIPLNTPFLK